ncbi:MAG TPA: pseudouridine synthase [Candidatus Kapabacteria bacterium]|nr:pseudouridine synthase [Candidatus Kapabacteria bacterium]
MIFNKPFGVLSQFTPAEAGDKPTLAAFGFPPHVYPVGRLDHDSEGLLLLSDDPGLTDYLLNPAHHHTRTYLAQVERIPDAEAIDRLEKGVIIEGKRTRPAAAVLLAQPPALPERSVPIRFRLSVPTAWLRLTLTEGRNRQVRRMTAAVGHPTLRLVRERIGRLDLFTLGIAPGTWRDLTTPELQLAMQQWRGSHRSEPPSA